MSDTPGIVITGFGRMGQMLIGQVFASGPGLHLAGAVLTRRHAFLDRQTSVWPWARSSS